MVPIWAGCQAVVGCAGSIRRHMMTDEPSIQDVIDVIEQLNQHLTAKINGVENRLGAKIDQVKDELKAEIVRQREAAE